MPIVGFSIREIDARRTGEVANSKINITSTPTIKGVKEVNLPGLDKKALEIDFDFLTNYSPEIGLIKLVGNLFFISGSDNAKALELWNKRKNLPDDEAIEVLNFLFRSCVMKVMQISDDLQLPPPINFPFVTAPPKNVAKPESQQKTEPAKNQDTDVDKQEKELEERIKKLTAK